ncbi:hypothetical protein CPLU01_08056 [Colletotrichum plurivorum]|uniref:Uncharacterized protein n=1 Tax=Colletotrichum plurivorum TaxID=2175906 RepID=A0A8H6ND93_9PEZI|nr:hypothetical protein CPLU01_08056 [Colletotrichum plurivorum]
MKFGRCFAKFLTGLVFWEVTLAVQRLLPPQFDFSTPLISQNDIVLPSSKLVTTTRDSPHHVADRLGDLYEAVIAELRRNGLGALATGTVDRVRQVLRERPPASQAWFLVDRWIELTTDGNDVLNLDNGIGAAPAGLGDMNLPSATARFAGLLNHRENAHIGRQAVGLDMASLYDMLVGDVEDRLARENLQLAKRLKQVEGEKQTMRMELDNLRTKHIAYRDRRRSTWMRTLCDIDYAGRVKRFEARKVVFQFLDFVEKKEETVLKEEKSSGLGIRDPIPSIEWK